MAPYGTICDVVGENGPNDGERYEGNPPPVLEKDETGMENAGPSVPGSVCCEGNEAARNCDEDAPVAMDELMMASATRGAVGSGTVDGKPTVDAGVEKAGAIGAPDKGAARSVEGAAEVVMAAARVWDCTPSSDTM
jgi:hypothetical protein